MHPKIIRAGVALILSLAAGAIGYTAGGNGTAAPSVRIPAETVSAPAAGTTRVLYSLDQKQNDK